MKGKLALLYEKSRSRLGSMLDGIYTNIWLSWLPYHWESFDPINIADNLSIKQVFSMYNCENSNPHKTHCYKYQI